jgi:cytochrome c oxidase cbb3-type subunit 3/ubiquinol-cytochrome c reductase cytochrome c subunit
MLLVRPARSSFAGRTFLRSAAFATVLFALALLASACRRADSKAPVVDGPEVVHGRELYTRMCAVCHGEKGEGYKADQAPRLAQPDFLASVSDDFLRGAVTNGRSGTTMSAWGQSKGGPLTPNDVNAVVKFVRSWQKEPNAKLDNRPLSGDAERGTQLFTQHCESCHGVRGVGGPNLHIAGPELLAGASNGFLRYAIERGRPGTTMQSFAKKLDKQAIDDVIVALRSWHRPAAVPETPPRVPPIPLGPVPLNPKGPEPHDFNAHPGVTSVDVVHKELARGARFGILDARAPSDYAREHISGAVSVPFYDPTPYFDALPKDVWLVCYCACPHAESGQLAQKLSAQGFKKVTVLDEGLNVWKSKGHPVTAGEKP